MHKPIIFLYFSSYAKIWGETKFQLRQFPRSGSKATSVERKKKEWKSVITMVSTYGWTKMCYYFLSIIRPQIHQECPWIINSLSIQLLHLNNQQTLFAYLLSVFNFYLLRQFSFWLSPALADWSFKQQVLLPQLNKVAICWSVLYPICATFCA